MPSKKQLEKEIKSLRKQLTEQTDEQLVERQVVVDWTPFGPICEKRDVLTLNGKIEAILEHLGIELTVNQKKTVPSKPAVKKVRKEKNVSKTRKR